MSQSFIAISVNNAANMQQAMGRTMERENTNRLSRRNASHSVYIQVVIDCDESRSLR